MEQRTCNIIMACKGHCQYAQEANSIVDTVKIYMGKECIFPWRNYTDKQITDILLEALYDYINGADCPGYELRQLFDNPIFNPTTLPERICNMFTLVQVKDDDGYVNDFTDELINQSEIDLSAPNDRIPCLINAEIKVAYPCYRECPVFGECLTKWHHFRREMRKQKKI